MWAICNVGGASDAAAVQHPRGAGAAGVRDHVSPGLAAETDRVPRSGPRAAYGPPCGGNRNFSISG